MLRVARQLRAGATRRLRVGATVAVASSAAGAPGARTRRAPAKAPNGTVWTVTCAPHGSVRVVLELNPSVRVEKGWGVPARNASSKYPAAPATNAVAVYRGPLLFTIPLVQIATAVKVWQPYNLTDLAMRTETPWNFALDLGSAMSFVSGQQSVNALLPFNISNRSWGAIEAAGFVLPSWVERRNAADEPPPSPLNCSSLNLGCGKPIKVTMVPYGTTNLRMAGLPWVAKSP